MTICSYNFRQVLFTFKDIESKISPSVCDIRYYFHYYQRDLNVSLKLHFTNDICVEQVQLIVLCISKYFFQKLLTVTLKYLHR